jgi:GNAT superfamily N-acetyltransferase
MAITVEDAKSREDLAEILDLPLRLHAADPSYVAPLRPLVMRRLNPKDPFFRDASIRFFRARRGRETVGTISLLIDERHDRHGGERTAFFGFFECERDPEVARALFDAVSERARALGATSLRGPRNVTRVEDIGLLVEGWSSRPPMLAGHHPPYYRELVEAEGFSKRFDMIAYETPLFDAAGRRRELPEDLRRKAAAVNIPGLEVRRVDWRHLSRDMELAHAVFTEAYRALPEVVPMPREQFVSLGRAFVALANHNLLQIATVHGAPAAFAVCLPELNEAFAAARGALLPFGWARVVAAFRRIRTASFKLIGVVPAFRSTGLFALLIQHVVDGLRAAGYERLEASLIHEDNGPMRHIVESAGCVPYRRYRVYERPLGRGDQATLHGTPQR